MELETSLSMGTPISNYVLSALNFGANLLCDTACIQVFSPGSAVPMQTTQVTPHITVISDEPSLAPVGSGKGDVPECVWAIIAIGGVGLIVMIALLVLVVVVECWKYFNPKVRKISN